MVYVRVKEILDWLMEQTSAPRADVWGEDVSAESEQVADADSGSTAPLLPNLNPSMSIDTPDHQKRRIVDLI